MSCRCAAMKWMARLIVSQQKESKVKARRTRGQEKRQEDIIGRDGNENRVYLQYSQAHREAFR